MRHRDAPRSGTRPHSSALCRGSELSGRRLLSSRVGCATLAESTEAGSSSSTGNLSPVSPLSPFCPPEMRPQSSAQHAEAALVCWGDVAPTVLRS